MNKLKVAVEALRDYLGADSHGLGLLERVTTIANDQRKRVAALEEASAASNASEEKQRSDLDKARVEARTARDDASREAAKRAAADAREKVLLAKIETHRTQMEPEPERDEPNGNGRFSSRLKLLKDVRKRYRKLPGDSWDGRDIVLEDFVTSFNSDELMGFGMVVAALAVAGWGTTVRSRISLSDFEQFDPEKHISKFVFWARSRIHQTRMEKDICARSFTTASDRQAQASAVGCSEASLIGRKGA